MTPLSAVVRDGAVYGLSVGGAAPGDGWAMMRQKRGRAVYTRGNVAAYASASGTIDTILVDFERAAEDAVWDDLVTLDAASHAVAEATGGAARVEGDGVTTVRGEGGGVCIEIGVDAATGQVRVASLRRP